MASPVIRIDAISKLYRLGQVGTGSLAHDINRWWYRIRGKEDPYLKVGQTNDRTRKHDANGSAPKSPDWVYALKDVSYDIQKGEVLGIIGRNGAGKSTLLKILSRVTAPSTGTIKVKGRIASLLEVGTGFHPELTGRENIYLNGAILGMRKREIDGKLDQIADFSGCAAYLDTPVKRYSTGMLVRLAFAVAAHLDPDVLIVDEVLAVGDLAFQRKCLGKMDEVAHRSGTTVLFVSHQLSAVRQLCSRAMLLDQGTVVEHGAVEPVLARYLQLNTDNQSPTTELPPGPADSTARGLAAHTCDMDGVSGSVFRLGQPWRIRLEFEVLTAHKQMVAAIGLRTVDGTPLITWWSAPQDLKPGRYAVEYDCRVPFCAGMLNFAVGITTEERSLYYVEGVGSVTISEVAVSEQPVRSSGTGYVVGFERPAISPLA